MLLLVNRTAAPECQRWHLERCTANAQNADDTFLMKKKIRPLQYSLWVKSLMTWHSINDMTKALPCQPDGVLTHSGRVCSPLKIATLRWYHLELDAFIEYCTARGRCSQIAMNDFAAYPRSSGVLWGTRDPIILWGYQGGFFSPNS